MRIPRRRLLVIALAPLVAITSYASIQIVGLQKVAEQEAREIIRPQVKLVEKNGASRPLADDASFFLERELRRRGFKEADVRWGFDDSSKDIKLTVDEGPSLELGEITISGNIAAIEAEDLRNLVRRTTSNRLRSSLLSKQGALPFVESEIATGLSDVAQLYRSLGYWHAKTAPLKKSTSTTGNQVAIQLQIEAGALHRYRAFKLEGDTDNGAAALESILAPLVGEPCTTENTSLARASVSEFYSKRGYYHHTIEVSPTDHGEEVTLVFSIEAGEPFEVAGIEVEGNERVKADFLRKRFKPLVDKPYSPATADEIYRELLEIGLFTKISVSPEERSEGSQLIDLLIDVEESKSRSVGVYGGYGSYDGAIFGLIFRENNVFGTGRQFKNNFEFTQRGLSGEAEYSDKWFYDTKLFFNASLFAQTEKREGYSKFEYGGRVGIGREIGEHYSVTVFGTLGHTEITEAEIEAVDLGLPNYRVASIGLAHSWDTRDNPTLPSRGFVFDNTFEYGSLLSDVEFTRGTIRFSAYIPITKRTQLSLGARSGFIIPAGDSKGIPIDMRFFSGGGSTVRSFREKHLGPRDIRGFPLGGEFYSTFNAEYSVPIVGGLKAAVFGDAGNLLRDFDDAGLGEMHYALGGGLRYDLPTGPIRVDYGWNMNRGEREPSGTLHISLGVAF
ncbi:MAG: outer membrane protein insertion porin family [Verrucomicrobiales bacterium]|jgi:outer membrane protein insertion porin family